MPVRKTFGANIPPNNNHPGRQGLFYVLMVRIPLEQTRAFIEYSQLYLE
jgi:hypothetical protein